MLLLAQKYRGKDSGRRSQQKDAVGISRIGGMSRSPPNYWHYTIAMQEYKHMLFLTRALKGLVDSSCEQYEDDTYGNTMENVGDKSTYSYL